MKEIKDNDLVIFINDCNANWLQGKLIELLLKFELSENEFIEINKWIDFGIEHDVYNGVPRMCQGNEVKDLAPHLKVRFDYLFDTYIHSCKYIPKIIYLILLGKYTEAKELLNNI